MQIIRETIKPFDQLLKKQKRRQGETYRLMNFVVEQPVEDGLLLYHTMTKALLLLSPEETVLYRQDRTALPLLVENWFLVPLSHDDRLLSRQMRDVARMLERTTDAITHYTILTTTDCNARCFYCYEMGRPRVLMSEETAQHTADYIIRHCQGKKVGINWFGGEPLYNKRVITLICQRLQAAGIDYTSTMITNGYLFNHETIREAVDLWHLDWVQISLDGTEKIYNRSKAYIYKDVNAYRRVIDNIHRLQAAGIKIRIRLNIDMYNADNLMELTEELHHEFSHTEGLCVYLHALFEEAAGSKAMHDEQKRAFIYQQMGEINKKLSEYGIAKPDKLDRKVMANACQADNDKCLVIMPSGHIGKCEHYIEDHFVGHIDHDDIDMDVVRLFKEQHDETETCATCPTYPLCIMLKLCQTSTRCYPETQMERIQKVRRGMLKAYQKYLNHENDEVQD
jgi:radical SAM protein with 4Fe4S-binding SPASM domain